MVFLSKLLGFWGNNVKINSTFSKNNKVTFQEQLEIFKELGFTFNEGIETSELNIWKGEHNDYEDNPFLLLYQTLGQTITREPWTPLTNKCWNFDTEAIEDHGTYIDIMQNISRITNGELKFEDLEDYVNIKESLAWVAFICNGHNYKWNLKVDDDWVDGELFDKVQSLATKYKTKGRFTYFDTGGQDFVLGYHTNEELEQLRQRTGLEIVWLNAKGQIY